MRAAVFLGAGRIEIRDVPAPVPGEREVLLRVTAAGVCGTDAHIYTGEVQNARPPVILGHEITGEVVEVGRGAGRFGRGDRVAVDPFVPCGRCEFCREGEERFCENERFFGYTLPGGFAEHVCAREENLYPVPAGLSLKQCALIEPLATVVAGMSRLKPEPGKTFLLLGAGTIGLLWLELLKRTAPRSVIQTEVVRTRRELALRLGADRVVDPRGGSLESAVRAQFPRGVDYIIDATGSAEAVAEALPLLKKGGTYLCFGICPEGERLPLSLNWFYRTQASFLTSRRPPREMERAIALMERGLVDAERLVTGIYPLGEIERAFARFFEGRDEEIKMAIDPWKG